MIEREPAFKHLLRDALTYVRGLIDNPVLMDIGANVGDYTLIMHNMMEEIPHKIIAIEPDPTTFFLLQNNMKFHEVGCICDSSAISDRAGESVFFAADKNNLSSLVSRDGIKKSETIVTCSTIEEILKKYNFSRVNLIKMDIEGGEVLALRGARDFLKESSNIKILMEVHPHLYTDELNLANELEFLFTHGWSCPHAITSALPEHIRGYSKGLELASFPVKEGWRRKILRFDDTDDLIQYACWSHMARYT
jgi:FkbM family methyltransferase